jgi:rhomboid family GlyGly-CTERM serine protease
LSRPALAWCLLATCLALLALVGGWLPREAMDWQPALVAAQPWRIWSPVCVHYSVSHLVGNLAGVGLAGVFGVAAQVPARAALAWLAAWPLTHLGLWPRSDLLHYGGLSGVVHAGVAIVIVHVLAVGNRRQRWVGSAVLLGFCGKLLSEAPWADTLRHPAGWDLATVPWAHASGAIAGALCAILGESLMLRSGRKHRTEREGGAKY